MFTRMRRPYLGVALLLSATLILMRDEISSFATPHLNFDFLPRQQSNKVSSDERCVPLEVTDDRFNLTLCYAADACNAGTITIQAPLQDCLPENARLTSNDQAEHEWTLEHLGPHSFHMQLFGVVHAAREPADYLGAKTCAYRFEFDARTAGPLGLQVYHVWDNYNSFVNIIQPPPVTVWKPLIYTPTVFSGHRSPMQRESIWIPPFDMCPASSPARAALPSHAQSLFKVWRAAEEIKRQEEAPVCSRERPVPGRFRVMHPSDMHKSLVAHRGYVWEPEPACRMDELPYYDTDPKDVQRMLERNVRNILFLGDSHDRYAYYFLRSWYGTNWTYLDEPYRLKEEHSVWTKGRVKMEFIWDRFMTMAGPTNLPTCQRAEQVYGRFDTIILTAGHHLALMDGGQTPEYPSDTYTMVNTFVDLVRQTVETFLKRCPPKDPSKRPRLVWIAPPPYRPPWTRFRWNDYRSNTRLRMYGLRAMEMLEKEFPEVALVDHYDLMLPVIQETKDTLHAFGTDAAYAVALEVHHKIGINKPRGWWLEPRDNQTLQFQLGGLDSK